VDAEGTLTASRPDDRRTAGQADRGPSWQFEVALLLGRYTVSRNSSVRGLRWSDIDLREGTVRWRRESDKSGREVVVPLLPEAIKALRRAPRHRRRVGLPEPDGPEQTDAAQHLSGMDAAGEITGGH
jgi:integrase